MPLNKNENRLIVFVKYPTPGQVKTRLAHDIGTVNAAAIYSDMATKLVDDLSRSQAYELKIYFDPPHKIDQCSTWLGVAPPILYPQQGSSLGERISNAFNNEFSSRASKVVIIGTDCIDVTESIIIDALNILDSNQVVIGPAHDGGYYLLGLDRYLPRLFDDIDWSTESVLEQTLTKVKTLGLTHKMLPALNDIDTVDDLSPETIAKLG